MNRIIAMLCAVAVVPFAAGCGGSQETASNETPAAETQAAAEPEVTITAAEAVRSTESGTEVTLYVTREGFVPANVQVPAGKPVTLKVTRKTDRTCATELVMAEHQIHQPLPLDSTVTITFTPGQAGELRYACGMDMITGSITVN